MKKTYIELYMRLIGNYYKLGQEIPVHVEVTIADGGNKNAIKKVSLPSRVGTLTMDEYLFTSPILNILMYVLGDGTAGARSHLHSKPRG